MKIDQVLLDTLSAQAKASPRLRMNYDFRNTPEDQSQRMLNALEPGTVMPIHRHRNTSETMVVLRGTLALLQRPRPADGQHFGGSRWRHLRSQRPRGTMALFGMPGTGKRDLGVQGWPMGTIGGRG